MAVLNALSAISRFIRRSPPPPDEVLEAYAHEVIPVMDRAEWLYDYWLEQSTLFTDGEKLGNVAAIHRWETATMGRSLERVIPPAVLAGAHAQVIEALEMASRAAQLLSNGSRFHNANVVCDGQAMLGVSRERRLAALKAMRRYLLRSRFDARLASDAAAAAAVAEVAALAAAQAAAASEPSVTAPPANTAPRPSTPALDQAVPLPPMPAPAAPREVALPAVGSASGAGSGTPTAPEHAEQPAFAARPPAPAAQQPSATPADSAPVPPLPQPATSEGAAPDQPKRDGWGRLFAPKPDGPDS